jgi:HK97 gp10 family phage protein
MNDKFTFELVGWDELVDELRLLPDNVKKNGINNVLKKESKAVETRAKQLVRKETGRLESVITAKKRRMRGNAFVKYTVGVPKGQNRKDRSGAFYAPFIEFGTSRIPEKSYLRKALEETAPGITSAIVSNVKNEINASLKRHNARAKKRAAK